MVGGCKGGCGKSMFAMALADYLGESRRGYLLIDGDAANPDVFAAYEGTAPRLRKIRLDASDGWKDLVAETESTGDDFQVIVNTPPNNGDAVARFGGILTGSLELLNRELLTFWVVNAQRDGLDMLGSYLDAVPGSPVHVVKNLFFGGARDFRLCDGSAAFAEAAARGGKSVFLPVMASRLAGLVYNGRLSIAKALRKASLTDRGELRRWRREAAAMFQELLDERY
jgi:hypothetical protein